MALREAWRSATGAQQQAEHEVAAAPSAVIAAGLAARAAEQIAGQHAARHALWVDTARQRAELAAAHGEDLHQRADRAARGYAAAALAAYDAAIAGADPLDDLEPPGSDGDSWDEPRLSPPAETGDPRHRRQGHQTARRRGRDSGQTPRPGPLPPAPDRVSGGPVDWPRDDDLSGLPHGAPLLAGGRLQTAMRDASWHDRPDVHSTSTGTGYDQPTTAPGWARHTFASAARAPSWAVRYPGGRPPQCSRPAVSDRRPSASSVPDNRDRWVAGDPPLLRPPLSHGPIAAAQWPELAARPGRTTVSRSQSSPAYAPRAETARTHRPAALAAAIQWAGQNPAKDRDVQAGQVRQHGRHHEPPRRRAEHRRWRRRRRGALEVHHLHLHADLRRGGGRGRPSSTGPADSGIALVA